MSETCHTVTAVFISVYVFVRHYLSVSSKRCLVVICHLCSTARILFLESNYVVIV